jgi:hypothetical protein
MSVTDKSDGQRRERSASSRALTLGFIPCADTVTRDAGISSDGGK